jgi:hypothetical protein
MAENVTQYEVPEQDKPKAQDILERKSREQLVAAEEYEGDINPADMTMPPQTKPYIEPETKEFGFDGDPRGGPSVLGSDTPVYGTETPYRKTPPHNFGTAAEAAATATPPTGAAVPQSSAIAGSTPVNTVAPAVTGTTVVGSALTCAPGTYVPAATGQTYQWYRAPDTVIAGATGAARTLAAGDVGFRMFCRVTPTITTYGAGVPKDSNTVGPITAT